MTVFIHVYTLYLIVLDVIVMTKKIVAHLFSIFGTPLIYRLAGMYILWSVLSNIHQTLLCPNIAVS